MDNISEEHRSWNMSRIRSRNTKPEIIVRSFLHRAGFRFRLHCIELPGSPDIVLPKYRSVVFVHGCFWHRHPGCKLAYNPKSRTDFWNKKFNENINRDNKNIKTLKEFGWKVFIVWECEVKDEKVLNNILVKLKESKISI